MRLRRHAKRLCVRNKKRLLISAKPLASHKHAYNPLFLTFQNMNIKPMNTFLGKDKNDIKIHFVGTLWID